MTDIIRKISDWTDRVMSALVLVLAVTMIAGCVLQVFTRYVLNNSLSWTEELARYAFISVTMISASTCVKNRSHATITFLLEILPQKITEVIVFLGDFVVAFASCVVIRYGLEIMNSVKGQSSTALHIPKSLLYMMVVIGCVGILIQTISNILIKLFEVIEKKGADKS